MKNIIFFTLFTITICSCKTSELSKYITAKNIVKERGYCWETYSKEGKLLSGAYKVYNGKKLKVYGIFKDGYYQEKIEEYQGFILSKAKYDEKHNIIEYTSFMNRKNKNADEYYRIQKYDSVKTLFQKNTVVKSIFYVNNKIYTVNYNKIEDKIMKLKTDINNFKIINNMDMLLAIPAEFFFSNCYNYIFLYDGYTNKPNEELHIEINEPNGVKYQTFELNDFHKKENHEVNFNDYWETTNYDYDSSGAVFLSPKVFGSGSGISLEKVNY